VGWALLETQVPKCLLQLQSSGMQKFNYLHIIGQGISVSRHLLHIKKKANFEARRMCGEQ
jgi:hypothetical protein